MPGRFAPHARIPAKAARVEDDGTFLANRPEKETDHRDDKACGQQAGGKEVGATSICKGIILVYGRQYLLLDGLFECQGKVERESDSNRG